MVRKDDPGLPYSLSNFPKTLSAVKFFNPKETPPQVLKAFVGWDGILIFDENLDVLQTLKIYAKQYQNYAQSCGRCTPGKYGGKVLYELLEKLQNHNYRDDDEALADIEKLREVCELMRATSKCEVGKTTPNPILQMLDSRPEVFASALPSAHRTAPESTSDKILREAKQLSGIQEELQQSTKRLQEAGDFVARVQHDMAKGLVSDELLSQAAMKAYEIKEEMAKRRLRSKVVESAKATPPSLESKAPKEAKETREMTLGPVDYGINRSYQSENRGLLEENSFEVLERYKSAITTRINEVTYISKITAPCTDECPSRVDIPAYIEGVKDLRYLDSLASTRGSMPLAQVCGRVCPHPCETACRRALLDDPISIMELKRVGADAEFSERHSGRWHGYANPNNVHSQAEFSQLASVGVIGAGPAGLSTAYYLALRGIKVEVYEALPVLGGEVAVGVPNYRMPIVEYNHDIESLRSLGVIFHTNFTVDSKNIVSLEEKHSALVIAVGTRASKKLGCKNERVELEGYLPAISFMDSVNLAQKFNIGELPNLDGKRVVCVGGGFTSMDVVRCCIRLGAKSVTMLYRRDEATIISNTSSEEYHEACEEGVEFRFLSAVDEILEEGGRLRALKVNSYELVKSEKSPKGELRLVEDGGFILPCDILIPAVSQEMDFPLDEGFGVEFSKWKTVVVDEASFSTTKKGIFAAGDCVSGPLTIVNAVGHGRRVASVVANYLKTGEVSINDDEKMEDLLKSIGVFDTNREVKGFLSGNGREVSKKLSASYRARNFEEVNLGLTREEALSEAQRCMRCYYISMCVVGEAEASVLREGA